MGKGGVRQQVPAMQQQIVAGRVDVAGSVGEHGRYGQPRQVDADRLVVPERFRTQAVQAQGEGEQQGEQ